MRLKHEDVVALKSALRSIHSRSEKALAIGFTADEILELFVPPEDHGFCRRAGGYFSPEWRSSLSIGYVVPPEVLLTVEIMSTETYPTFHRLPDGVTKIASTAPDHLRERLSEWIDERYRIGRLFGLASAMLGFFEERKTDVALIKLFWPALGVLATHSEVLEAFREKLSKLSTPRRIPPTSPEFSAAGRETTAVITAATLLPKVASLKMDYVVKTTFRQEKHVSFGVFTPM